MTSATKGLMAGPMTWLFTADSIPERLMPPDASSWVTSSVTVLNVTVPVTSDRVTWTGGSATGSGSLIGSGSAYVAAGPRRWRSACRGRRSC